MRAGWLLVAASLLLFSFGWTVNDEADQSANLHNLVHGSLRVVNVPDSSYVLDNDSVQVRRWGDDPVGSRPLELLAVPVAGAVLAMDRVAPLGLWATLAVAVALSLAAWGDLRTPKALATAAALTILLGGGLRFPGPDARYYWATIALQVTNLLLSWLGAWMLWRLSGHFLQSPAARRLVVAATVAGSWLFWGQALKYHLLAAVLVLAVLLLLCEPDGRRRSLALGLVAGIACWANPGVGLVIVAGLAIALLAGPRRIPRYAWTAVGGLVGLLPFMAESMALYGVPLHSWYFGGPSTSGVQDAGGALVVAQRDATLLDTVRNLASLLTFGGRLDGMTVGILAITPLLALAALSVRRRASWGPAAWFALTALAVQALAFTNPTAAQGTGPDARLWLHLLPCLALLAMLGGAPWLDRVDDALLRSGGRFAALAILAGLAAWGLLAQAGYRFGGGSWEHERTFFFCWMGLLAGITLLLALLAALRAVPRPAVATGLVAFALAVPALWAILMLLLHPTHLPQHGAHAGGRFAVPAMDDMADALKRLVEPDYRRFLRSP